MHVLSRAYWMPKAGNSEAEYEDAFWPRFLDGETNQFRFAVADGATESSFSGIWARQIVRAFGKGDLDLEVPSSQLAQLQNRWWHIVRQRPLPWYAEEKASKGAFASFLGFLLEEEKDQDGELFRQWKAVALGDSCLFHIRGEDVLVLFPLDRSELFTNRPLLLPSRQALSGSILEHLCVANGTWMPGDTFYLVTDAIAHWFVRELEAGQKPWPILRDFQAKGPDQPFRDWIADLRTSRAIRNDDVTLLRVDIR